MQSVFDLLIKEFLAGKRLCHLKPDNGVLGRVLILLMQHNFPKKCILQDWRYKLADEAILSVEFHYDGRQYGYSQVQLLIIHDYQLNKHDRIKANAHGQAIRDNEVHNLDEYIIGLEFAIDLFSRISIKEGIFPTDSMGEDPIIDDDD